MLVGHSVGAAGMCFASSAFPQLFETLILVDPTIFHEDTNRWTATGGLVEGAIVRRNMWDSRDSARSAFAKNKGFYGLWDPDVREGFVQFGLVPEALDSQGGAGAEGKVVLKVDRMQEAVSSTRLAVRELRLTHRVTVCLRGCRNARLEACLL